MKHEKSIIEYLSERREHEKDNLYKETSIRGAFHSLIKKIAKGSKIYDEDSEKTKSGSNISYDAVFIRGGVKYGNIEDKDCYDKIDDEIRKKRNSGYKFDNIIFQDGYIAILFQDDQEIGRAIYMCSSTIEKYKNVKVDLESFDKLLEKFIKYIPTEAIEFNKKLETFKNSVPVISKKIKDSIDDKLKLNCDFKIKFNEYEKALKVTIGESLTSDDLKEMLVQHILTADLFNKMFDIYDYRKYNNIAKMLDSLEYCLGIEFSQNINIDINDFYDALSHNIKTLNNIQYRVEVLRIFYESFYQAYYQKKSDVLGIKYTPIEAVDFMIALSDKLLEEHFDKNIYSKDVNILDPCTGTGTFVVQILEYRLRNKLVSIVD